MARVEKATALFQADERGFARGLSRMEKRMGAFKRGFSRSLGGLKTVAGFGGIGGLVGASVGLGKAAGEALDFEEGLTRLNIASSRGFGSLDDLRGRIEAVSRATGVSRGEILKSLSGYVALTGDAKGAAQQMELFAQVQRATGAAMGDITDSAAAMVQNLKINPADMERAFSVLIQGGKKGAVELRDMAGLLASLAPLGARFAGGEGVEGLSEMSAALQLARQGFGSAAEAATGVESLMGAIVKNARKLEKSGVKVFNKDAKTGKKELRGFREIVDSIGDSKLAKDPTLLIKALGRKEAEQTLIQLLKVDGAWEGLARSTLNAKDVSEDYAAFQESASAKIQKAWNELKLLIAEVFTPERIKAFADALGDALIIAKGIAEAVGVIADFIDAGDSAEIKPTSKEVGMSDDELDFRIKQARASAGLGDTGPDPAGGHPELERLRSEQRRRKEEIKSKRDVAAEIDRLAGQGGGAPALGVPAQAAFEGGGFDEAADIAARERAVARGGFIAREGARRGKEEIDVRVYVDKDANIKAAIDNHRSQAVSP